MYRCAAITLQQPRLVVVRGEHGRGELLSITSDSLMELERRETKKKDRKEKKAKIKKSRRERVSGLRKKKSKDCDVVKEEEVVDTEEYPFGVDADSSAETAADDGYSNISRNPANKIWVGRNQLMFDQTGPYKILRIDKSVATESVAIQTVGSKQMLFDDDQEARSSATAEPSVIKDNPKPETMFDFATEHIHYKDDSKSNETLILDLDPDIFCYMTERHGSDNAMGNVLSFGLDLNCDDDNIKSILSCHSCCIVSDLYKLDAIKRSQSLSDVNEKQFIDTAYPRIYKGLTHKLTNKKIKFGNKSSSLDTLDALKGYDSFQKEFFTDEKEFDLLVDERDYDDIVESKSLTSQTCKYDINIQRSSTCPMFLPNACDTAVSNESSCDWQKAQVDICSNENHGSMQGEISECVNMQDKHATHGHGSHSGLYQNHLDQTQLSSSQGNNYIHQRESMQPDLTSTTRAGDQHVESVDDVTDVLHTQVLANNVPPLPHITEEGACDEGYKINSMHTVLDKRKQRDTKRILCCFIPSSKSPNLSSIVKKPTLSRVEKCWSNLPSCSSSPCIHHHDKSWLDTYQRRCKKTRSPDQMSRGFQSQSSTMSSIKNKPTRNGDVMCELDLTYITERIIAMTFLSEAQESNYRSSLKEVTQMLKNKHAENYMIVNLSERRSDLHKHSVAVLDFGWPDCLAPPIERLCSICKSIDSWLNSDVRNVAVLHCKGGRERMGIVIAAYMHYNNICASADQALDRFAMKSFYDDKLGQLTYPSQRRYVHYFAGLLSGAIKINSAAVYLHHIILTAIPNYDGRGGCRPYIKVYQGMQPVYMSGVYTVTNAMQQICISLDPSLALRGDILLKFYHKSTRSGKRELIFRCQFHTCAISDNSLIFNKQELDEAATDTRFPSSARVEFVFSTGRKKLQAEQQFRKHQVEAADPAVEPLDRWDSYEDFNLLQTEQTNVLCDNSTVVGGDVSVMRVQHTEGPLDGSLYATVTKKTHTTQQVEGVRTVRNLQTGQLSNSADSGISSTTLGYTSSSTAPPRTAMATTVGSMPTSSHLSNSNALDDHTQLDEILNELLSESKKLSLGGDSRTVAQASSLSPSYGSITTNSGNSRTVVSWQTSTAGPASKAGTVTKHTVSNPFPNAHTETIQTVHKEEFSYNSPPTPPMRSTTPKIPPNAFSYGNVFETKKVESQVESFQSGQVNGPPPPPQRSASSRLMSARDNVSSPTFRSQAASPGPNKLPYKIDYDLSADEVYRGYESDSGTGSKSWLQQQKQKLLAKREGRETVNFHTEQEKQLVHELKAAQANIFRKRAASECAEADILDQYEAENKNMYSMVNGTTAETVQKSVNSSVRESRPMTRTIPLQRSQSESGYDQYRTEKSYFVSGVERPAFTTHQTKYTFTISPPKSAGMSQQETVTTKPPPSPGPGRSAPSSPLIPSRGSYRPSTQRSRSLTAADAANWRSTRQHSDTSNKSLSTVMPHRTTHAGKVLTLPSRSSLQYQKISSSSYHHSPPSPAKPPRSHHRRHLSDSHMPQLHTTASNKHNVPSRTGSYESSRQTESFETRQHNTYEESHWESKKVASDDEIIEEEVVSLQPIGLYNLEYESQQQEQEKSAVSAVVESAGRGEEDYVEEEVVTLQPIGPGLQSLEPEVEGVVTHGRPPTPSFPTAGIGSPNTPYENKFEQQGQQLQQQDVSMSGSYASNSMSLSRGSTPLQSGVLYGEEAFPPQVSPPSYSTLPARAGLQHSSVEQQHHVRQDRAGLQHSTLPHRHTPQHAAAAGGGAGGMERSYSQDEVERRLEAQMIEVQPTPEHSPARRAPQTESSIGVSMSSSAGGSSRPDIQQYQQQQQLQQQQQYQQQQLQQQQQQQLQQQQLQQQQQQLQQQQQQQQQLQYQQQQVASNHIAGQHSTQQQQMLHIQNMQQDRMDASSDNSGAMKQLSVDISHSQNHGYFPRSPSSVGSEASPRFSPAMLGTTSSAGARSASSGEDSMRRVAAGTPSTLTGGQSSPSLYFGQSRGGSLSSLADGIDVVHHTPRFVRDTSKVWYKPHISREDAINLLKDKQPGTFVVRDSNSFPGAFGLAVKVAHVPPNVQTKAGDPQAELVRHFLIEPTSKGVKLKGCSNEPVFGSLAALVYQHSITPLALPCKLLLPELEQAVVEDTVDQLSVDVQQASSSGGGISNQQLLHQGAACNVIYLNTLDMESLTGPEAVSKAVKETVMKPASAKTTLVHFKVSSQGVTLTDNKRRLFFRRHYPVSAVTFCGMDPDDRRWTGSSDDTKHIINAKCFGFVARKQGSATDNACHIFAEADPDQPATAIVNFVTKVMIGQNKL